MHVIDALYFRYYDAVYSGGWGVGGCGFSGVGFDDVGEIGVGVVCSGGEGGGDDGSSISGGDGDVNIEKPNVIIVCG